MNYSVTGEQLTAIADAIRAKTGDSDPIEFPTEFVSDITELPVLDTSDATATAMDIKQEKTAYVNGSKILGMYIPQVTRLYENVDPVLVSFTVPSGKPAGWGAISYYPTLNDYFFKEATVKVKSGTIDVTSQYSVGTTKTTKGDIQVYNKITVALLTQSTVSKTLTLEITFSDGMKIEIL